jgi:hypothetical protein
MELQIAHPPDRLTRIQQFDVVRRGQDRYAHHPVGINALCDVRFVNAELVSGQRAGLVRAEDVATSKGFDSRQPLHNCLAPCKISSADGERSRSDAWETNGNTDDLHPSS